VTWSDDVEMEARQLLESLRAAAYDNLVEVTLSTAAQAWSPAEARLALARGAAMAVANAGITYPPVNKGTAEDDPPQGQSKPASHARVLAMLTAGVVAVVVALTYQVHTDGSLGG